MTQSMEINTSVAMLVSVFGNPIHADAEANNYEWYVEFPDGGSAILKNLRKGGSAGRVQAWEVSCSSEAAAEQVTAKLEEGENYYEGGLHPELFIKRDN